MYAHRCYTVRALFYYQWIDWMEGECSCGGEVSILISVKDVDLFVQVGQYKGSHCLLLNRTCSMRTLASILASELSNAFVHKTGTLCDLISRVELLYDPNRWYASRVESRKMVRFAERSSQVTKSDEIQPLMGDASWRYCSVYRWSAQRLPWPPVVSRTTIASMLSVTTTCLDSTYASFMLTIEWFLNCNLNIVT